MLKILSPVFILVNLRFSKEKADNLALEMPFIANVSSYTHWLGT